MTILARGIEFFRDDCGSELAEYALVISLFAVISLVAMQQMSTKANARVETDETNYTNAFVNGY